MWFGFPGRHWNRVSNSIEVRAPATVRRSKTRDHAMCVAAPNSVMTRFWLSLPPSLIGRCWKISRKASASRSRRGLTGSDNGAAPRVGTAAGARSTAMARPQGGNLPCWPRQCGMTRVAPSIRSRIAWHWCRTDGRRGRGPPTRGEVLSKTHGIHLRLPAEPSPPKPTSWRRVSCVPRSEDDFRYLEELPRRTGLLGTLPSV